MFISFQTLWRLTIDCLNRQESADEKKWLRTYGDLILFLRTILTLRKRQYNVTLLTNTAHFSHRRLELSQILNVSSVKNEPSLLFVHADQHFDIKEMWNTLRWTICHFSTIHTHSWCNLQQEKNKFLVLFQNQLLNIENNLVVKLQLSCDQAFNHFSFYLLHLGSYH